MEGPFVSTVLAVAVWGASRPEADRFGIEETDSPAESREPTLGAGEIRDLLVDLGFEKLDVGTVRNCMPRQRHRKDLSGNWLRFIRNQPDVSWAMDFCVVGTIG